MADTSIPAWPIARGYSYSAKVTVTTEDDEAIFPAGCRLAAQFRDYAGAGTVQASATTENGKLSRIDDDTVLIQLDAADMAAMDGSVVFDLVRTDLSPDQWLGVQVCLPVAAVATQTGGDA